MDQSDCRIVPNRTVLYTKLMSQCQGSVAMDQSDCRILPNRTVLYTKLMSQCQGSELSRISCNGPIRLQDFTQPHCTLHKIDESVSRISCAVKDQLQWTNQIAGLYPTALYSTQN